MKKLIITLLILVTHLNAKQYVLRIINASNSGIQYAINLGGDFRDYVVPPYSTNMYTFDTHNEDDVPSLGVTGYMFIPGGYTTVGHADINIVGDQSEWEVYADATQVLLQPGYDGAIGAYQIQVFMSGFTAMVLFGLLSVPLSMVRGLGKIDHSPQ